MGNQPSHPALVLGTFVRGCSELRNRSLLLEVMVSMLEVAQSKHGHGEEPISSFRALDESEIDGLHFEQGQGRRGGRKRCNVGRWRGITTRAVKRLR